MRSRLLIQASLLFFVATGAACAPTEGEDAESSEDAVERSRGSMTDDELRAFRESFQADYVSRHEAAKAIADGPVPASAEGAKVLEWVDASIALGRITEADAAATGALRGTATDARTFHHHLAAARASRFALDFDRAAAHFTKAAELARGKDARAIAFERAELAAIANEFDVKPAIDAAIGDRFGSQASNELVANVIAQANAVQPFQLTLERERELNRAIDAWDDAVSAAWMVHYMALAAITSEYRYHDAMKMLASRRGKQLVASLPAAHLSEIGRNVHRAIMNHANDRLGWSQGKTFITALSEYQRKDQLLFGLAAGPYDYVELKESACKETLTKGADTTALKDAQKGYLDGTLTPTAALAQIAPLRAEATRADVEVFAGTMLESKGDDDGALEAYWKARQVCPWYGRAMSGTSGIMDRKASAARSRALRLTLPGRPPAVIREYVSDYDILSGAQKNATAYGLVFWWPYLQAFKDSGRTLYVSPTFQRITETPAFAQYADEYTRDRGKGDGRLTDDLDGIGGDNIVVAFAQLDDQKSGTVVHEAAHQFHFAAPAPIQACIKKLYDSAKERNEFCVGYAATNEHEYFGVAVQHYALPDGYVGYGGVTKAWYQTHDPKVVKLIDSIKVAAGDMDAIACPP